MSSTKIDSTIMAMRRPKTTSNISKDINHTSGYHRKDSYRQNQRPESGHAYHCDFLSTPRQIPPTQLRTLYILPN